MADPPILEARNVTHEFDVSLPSLQRVLSREPRRYLRAVNDVSFGIESGTTLSLVGESGCGKSTIARLCVGLYTPNQGDIRFEGMTLADARKQGRVRRQMNMIFQDPYASLNPRWRVMDIIAEPIRTFGLEKDPVSVRRRVEMLLDSGRVGAVRRRKVPARIFRWTTATRFHRARPVVGAGVSRVRRTHQRAGRFGAGANPEFNAGFATTAWAYLLVHQPQPRRGSAHVRSVGRDVSRPHRRAGLAETIFPAAVASVYAAAAGCHSGSGSYRPVANAGRRRCAEPDRSTSWLRVSSALSLGQRALPGGGTGGCRCGWNSGRLSRGQRGAGLNSRHRRLITKQTQPKTAFIPDLKSFCNLLSHIYFEIVALNGLETWRREIMARQAGTADHVERSGALDAIRGLAITLVVAQHWFKIPFGWTGVDLFFILSGYLLGGILLDNRSSAGYFSTFYMRRAFRILPLYLAVARDQLRRSHHLPVPLAIL